MGAAGAMGARVARVALCGVALLCALGLAQRPPGGLSCGPGRHLHGTGTSARCCRSCTPGPGAGRPGEGGSAPLLRGLFVPCPAEGVCPELGCQCVQPEFHCGDPQCKSCKYYSCPPGQRAWPVGKFNFGFECIDCAAGTFSGGREGRCKPWAEAAALLRGCSGGRGLTEGSVSVRPSCSKLGFPTAFPGNKTHDAVCSPGLPPTEPHGLLTAILLALAACILALTVTQLSLHIWQLRRQRVRPPETQLLLEAPPPPPEDACSCPFPEEERGEPLSENKGRLEDLWV
eukprot:bmy_10016T0